VPVHAECHVVHLENDKTAALFLWSVQRFAAANAQSVVATSTQVGRRTPHIRCMSILLSKFQSLAARIKAILTMNKNRNITPKPSGWIYAYGMPGHPSMSEAPPPPAPAPVVATSRFQAERFVLQHPEDAAAPLFPILGRSTDNESTPRIGHSIVPLHSLIAAALLEFAETAREREEIDALAASNTKPCDIQLQTLEPLPSESSGDVITPTPILPLIPCGDWTLHRPPSNHQAKSKPFLKQRKAKTFDELIDETVKA
jgi:hypothetical protein